jgi:nucleoside-diphosphate-sugar epimerase
MKIAVTGSSGRVGKAIVEMALAQGNSVVCIDRVKPNNNSRQPDLDYIQADLTDYSAFETALRGCDALVHMAAIAAPGHHPDHEVHTMLRVVTTRCGPRLKLASNGYARLPV